LAIVLLVGAVFFQVMAQFMVPLFLACVLLVVFEPLHRWMLERIPRWPRTAALLTTVLILLVVFLPLLWLGWRAYVDFNALLDRPGVEFSGQVEAAPSAAAAPPSQSTADSVATAADIIEGSTNAELHPEEVLELSTMLRNFVNSVLTHVHFTWWRMNDETAARGVAWASAFAGNFVLSGVKSAFGILVGLLITVVSLYYFLADGPGMVRALMRLSPLDERYERELLERFTQVSRAVVVATLLSAVAQGVLAGIGYYFALPAEAPIFLLTALTIVTAMIPFFGAAAVWILVCLWIYVYGEAMTAIILAAYCTVIVSGIDNVIKPLVLHGQSNLHPLLALLSILGGVTVLGPVGILIGPMLVSFLQALLNMLRKELESFGGVEPDAQQLATVVDALGAAGVDDTAPSLTAENAVAKKSADGRQAAVAKTPASTTTPAERRGWKRKHKR
jgi:predicted PurR-regulated permease PerM